MLNRLGCQSREGYPSTNCTRKRINTMPTKVLTLVCGIACGLGIALAVHAAADRGTENSRLSDRGEQGDNRRESARPPQRRESDDRERGRYQDRGDDADRSDRRNDEDRYDSNRA